MLKYEASLRTWSPASPRLRRPRDKPLIEEAAEQRGADIPKRADVRRFFRFSRCCGPSIFRQAALFFWLAWTCRCCRRWRCARDRRRESGRHDRAQRHPGPAAVFLCRAIVSCYGRFRGRPGEQGLTIDANRRARCSRGRHGRQTRQAIAHISPAPAIFRHWACCNWRGRRCLPSRPHRRRRLVLRRSDRRRSDGVDAARRPALERKFPWRILAAFALSWLRLSLGGRHRPLRRTQVAAFWPTLFQFGYAVAGLWFGAAFVAIGLGASAATLAPIFGLDASMIVLLGRSTAPR